jgi:hypothetical protein
MANRCAVRVSIAVAAGLALAAGGVAGSAGSARALVATTAAAAATPAAVVAGGTISTAAGGVGGPGPARSVAMVNACGLRAAGASLYIGTGAGNIGYGSALRRVNVVTGALTTVAGNGAAGPVGDGGAATATAVGPCSSTVDPAGNLVIPDGLTVRLVAAKTGTFYGQKMTAGRLYTVAGNLNNARLPSTLDGWTGGPTGDGGPATKAYLGSADDVTFDRAGNMLIADSGYGEACPGCVQAGALLRVVAAKTGTFYGVAMKAGDIYSIAGRDVGPGTESNGGPAAGAWLGPGLSSAEVDRSGNIILAGDDLPPDQSVPYDTTTPYLRIIATVGGTFYGQKMTAGHLYQVAGNATQGPYSNAVAGTKTSLWAAADAVADLSGNLVIADGGEVRVVAARSGRFYAQNMKAGYIYRIAGSPSYGDAGDGGSALRAGVWATAIAVDGYGNVALAQRGYRVRVIAARTGLFYGQKMTVGDIYTVAGDGQLFSGSGGAPLAAEFGGIDGVTVSGRGDIAFVSTPFSSVLQLTPARSGTLFGRKMTAGTLYDVAVRGGQEDINGDAPLAFDRSGNLVVADAEDGPNFNGVWLVAAAAGTFYGQKMTAGDTYAIAGGDGPGFSGDRGPARGAELNGPDGVTVDRHGNVIIADQGNNRVRVVAAASGSFYGIAMHAGDIYTVAGDGASVYGGDGGRARTTGVQPVAVAVDANGNLIVSDDSQRVRVVAASTGTFYGQKMTVGDIYTIAGDGTAGFSGSGGPATKAEFSQVGGVAVDGHGNVIVTDTRNHVVWAIAARTGRFYGRAMTVGDSYVVAGGGSRILGDGGPATAAKLDPVNVAVSTAGLLLVTDNADSRIRAIAP